LRKLPAWQAAECFHDLLSMENVRVPQSRCIDLKEFAMGSPGFHPIFGKAFDGKDRDK
jgi:hypothetical protein